MCEPLKDHDKPPVIYRSPNIMSILAVLSTTWILSIFTMVLFIKPVCGDGTTNLIVQAVFGLIMLVFGFYFGTSYGSQVKTDLMSRMETKPGTNQIKRSCCRPDPHGGEGSGGAVG